MAFPVPPLGVSSASPAPARPAPAARRAPAPARVLRSSRFAPGALVPDVFFAVSEDFLAELELAEVPFRDQYWGYWMEYRNSRVADLPISVVNRLTNIRDFCVTSFRARPKPYTPRETNKPYVRKGNKLRAGAEPMFNYVNGRLVKKIDPVLLVAVWIAGVALMRGLSL